MLGTGKFSSPNLCAEETKPKVDEKLGFFFVSDTHYLAPADAPNKLDDVSRETNARLVETLNRLAGTEIPAAAGGEKFSRAARVIHGGDLIDSGDKSGPRACSALADEWAGFVEDYMP